jgi:hypothetical protein
MSGQSSIKSFGNNSILRSAISLCDYIRREGFRAGLSFTWLKIRAALARNSFFWNALYRLNPFVQTGDVSDYASSASRVWDEICKLSMVKRRVLTANQDEFQAHIARAGYEQFDPYYRGGDSGDARHRSEKLF